MSIRIRKALSSALGGPAIFVAAAAVVAPPGGLCGGLCGGVFEGSFGGRAAYAADPAGDMFTYQGKLTQNGEPVTGAVNLAFMLFDAEEAGNQVGPTLNAFGFDAFDDQGLFTIDLEFGKGVFDGSPRWLEVWVNGSPLAPRQPIMPAPYAVRALTLGALADASFVGTYSNEVELSNANNLISGAFNGSGAGLTNLNASSINTGTIGSSLLSGTYSNSVDFNNPDNAFRGTFQGSGALLTSLNASNLTSGTVPSGRLSGTYSGALTFSNASNSFTGNGAGLTSLNASNISSGTIANARTTGSAANAANTLVLRDASGNFAASTITGSFSGNGALLAALNASNISTGTLADARLSSNVALRNAANTFTQTNIFNGNVGINGSADERLTVRANADEDAVRVRVGGATKFIVKANGGIGIGDNFTDVPNNGLRVLGNVGLGTGEPEARLHIIRASSATVPHARIHSSSTNGFARLRMSTEGQSSYWDIGVGGSDNRVDFWNSDTGSLMYLQGSTQRVGVRITNPQATLHVAEDTDGMGVIMPGMRVFQNTVSPNVIGGHSANEIGTSPGIFNAATIAGGGTATSPNRALSSASTVGGGTGNTAGATDAFWATVAGGFSNTASGSTSTIGGGSQNTASGGQSTVIGGFQNVASGIQSTVAGGSDNVAAGAWAFAAGRRAKANHDGAFVLTDSTNADRASDTTNRFHARFVNGYKLFTNSGGTLGVQALANATSWSSISDRNVKHNIEQVDPVDIVHRLASVPISWWNYIDDSDNVQHMGPMAQDFHAAFGLGASETHIATLDADGVALAAIQGVYLLVQEKDAEIEALHERIDRLEAIILHLTTSDAKGANR